MDSNRFDNIPMLDDGYFESLVNNPISIYSRHQNTSCNNERYLNNSENEKSEGISCRCCNFEINDPNITAGEQAIIDIFRTGGKLNSSALFFKERTAQIDMVKSILKAIKDKKNLVVEAGTGTGKTFAYLIPLLQLGKKAVVSTRTKNLQEQLSEKDVSYLVSIFRKDYKVAILKGRDNYLCLDRIDFKRRNYSSSSFLKFTPDDYFKELQVFAEDTLSGDIADFHYSKLQADEPDEYIYNFVAKSSTCKGRKCHFYERCFLNLARNVAQEADLLIVNHSLFLADVKLRKDRIKFSMLPPNIDVVVFDEAHHLINDVMNAFATEVSKQEIVEVSSLITEMADIIINNENLSVLYSNNKEKIRTILIELHKSLNSKTKDFILSIYGKFNFKETFSMTNKSKFEISLSLNETLDKFPNFDKYCKDYIKDISLIIDDFRSKAKSFMLFEDASPIIDLLEKTLTSISDYIYKIEQFIDYKDNLENACVVYIHEDYFKFTITPLDVANKFREHVLHNSENKESSEKNVSSNTSNNISSHDEQSLNSNGKDPLFFFTSATLVFKNSFNNFIGKLGLDNVYTCSLPSPFDYARQGCLYLPNNIPHGKDYTKQHYIDVINYAQPLLSIISGGFLFLCTSNTVMKDIYWFFKQHPNYRLGRNIYCQSAGNKTELIRRMQSEKNAIVIATQSFWEGVDIRGKALSCVVIDRLPFKAKTDPLVQAQIAYYEQVLKTSAFSNYSFPEMIVSLKQGIGRLIRSEDDIGVVAIADDRIDINSNQSYSSMIRQELPPMATIRNIQEVKNFLLKNTYKQ